LREAGETPARILATLRAEGVTETDRCVYGWVRKLGPPRGAGSAAEPPKEVHSVYSGASGAATVAAAEAAAADPTPGAVPSETELTAALESDDPVAYLRTFKVAVVRALAEWTVRLGQDRRAVNSARDLVRLGADIDRALIDLTPQPEAEAQRLEALGSSARDALLARARAGAVSDEAASLRRQVAAQAAMIDALAGTDRA